MGINRYTFFGIIVAVLLVVAGSIIYWINKVDSNINKAQNVKNNFLSNKIAFTSISSNGKAENIYLMDSSGENSKKVYGPIDQAADISWSPKGRYLGWLNKDFYYIDVGNPTEIYAHSIKSIDIQAYSWSPDEKNIAILTSDKEYSIIAIFDLASGSKIKEFKIDKKNIIVKGPDNFAGFYYVDWVSNEDLISFFTENDHFVIATFNINKGIADKKIIENPEDFTESFALNSKRNQVVYQKKSSENENLEVWLADIDGKNKRKLTEVESIYGGIFEAKFSPDDVFLAYNGNEVPFTILNLENGSVETIPYASEFDWSPDSRKLVISSLNPSEELSKISLIDNHGKYIKDLIVRDKPFQEVLNEVVWLKATYHK